MKTSSFAVLALLSTFLSLVSSSSVQENFLQCLLSDPSTPVYTPNTTSYTSVLQFSKRNFRFNSSTTPQPQLIVQPLNPSHVQAAVVCSRKYGLHLRTRSGGHDYEGLSYTSASTFDVPFVIVDLMNMSSVSVDAECGTAWVQAGATVGQVYYRIAEKTKTFGFPAAVLPTVGVGGHFSGGGYGTLMRKYGLAADNVVDAWLINADGKIVNRKSMGEDLFWAIRGGGAASFGVVIAWKIKLVPVPPTVTVFRVDRTLEQGATALVARWQYVAPKLPQELFIRITVTAVNSPRKGERTIQASFDSVFLGEVENLIPIMEQQFPELGLRHENCTAMSWIQSTLFIAGLPPDVPLDALMDRTSKSTISFKAKSDYVMDPISETGLAGIWKLFLEEDIPLMYFIPYGGRMSEIPESDIPFPHRKGNLFHITPFSFWVDSGSSCKHMDWMTRVYEYLTPYVSKSPRSSYLNYRDLDLGQSIVNGTSTYAEAKEWGLKYFNNNYDRLVKVKSKVDPTNFFRNEQSIPTGGGEPSVEDNDLLASL